MSVILFIVILGVLVFVHELGHFLVAKKFGIRVDEFALGFPPRLFSVKKGETEYSLNLIPFGGYVKIFGEDFTAIASDDPDKARSFSSKNRGVQSVVLVAGIAANVVFAWMLLSSVFIMGAPVASEQYPDVPLYDERVLVVEVFENSPAHKAGVLSGDTIRSIRGEAEGIDAPSLEELRQFISAREGREVIVGIERKDGLAEYRIIPTSGIVEDGAGIGISMNEVGTLKLPLFKALLEGARRTIDLSLLTARGLGEFLYRIVVFDADFSSVAGPVGIAVLVSEAEALGWFYIVSFTAIISLNLAIINLIPFPALDGGRLFFVLIEAVIRKPLPQKLVYVLNAGGFILLLALLLFVTYKDILHLL